MESIDRFLIERECERLVVQFCHYVDHGQAQQIADLFSEDGVWTAPGAGTLTGRDELRAGLGERQAKTSRVARHVCSNLLLDVLDEDTAQGVVYVTIYRHDRPEGESDQDVAPVDLPLMLGEYRDRYVRTPKGWRFARREVAVAFRKVRPNSRPAGATARSQS